MSNKAELTSLLSQIDADITKGRKESLVSKLKEIQKKRRDLLDTIATLDLQAQKLVDDFNSGLPLV